MSDGRFNFLRNLFFFFENLLMEKYRMGVRGDLFLLRSVFLVGLGGGGKKKNISLLYLLV